MMPHHKPHNSTLIRRFRESLNWADNDSDYGIDVNAAGALGLAGGLLTRSSM